MSISSVSIAERCAMSAGASRGMGAPGLLLLMIGIIAVACAAPVRAANGASGIEAEIDRSAPVLDLPGADLPDGTPPNDISASRGLSPAPVTDAEVAPAPATNP